MRNGFFVMAALCGVLAGGARAEDVFQAGRMLEDERDARVSIVGGSIISMEGFVNETHRALYDVTGNTYKQNPEGYDLDTDFEITSGGAVVGLGFEKAWKYFTIEGQVLGMNPQTDSTARRNYYLTVGGVDFNGNTYDHIKISAGTPFHAEFIGAMFDLNALVTPFSIQLGPTARFSPWVGLGVFGLAGSYEIDAGDPTGTTFYQNPPEEFVIGGQAEGDAIGALPELVIGGEFVFGDAAATHFALQGYFGFFTYSGSSGYFSNSDQNYDKHADIEHAHARVRGALDIPLESGRVITGGVQYEYVDTQATLKSTADTPEEILARQERYDKEGDITMSILTAFVGLAF